MHNNKYNRLQSDDNGITAPTCVRELNLDMARPNVIKKHVNRVLVWVQTNGLSDQICQYYPPLVILQK